MALELTLRALGIGPGDDVATVSHSFIATANAVVTVGARPIFADIQAETYGMDAKALEPALTPRTRAILAVHQLGYPCDLEGILAVAERRGIPVIEDAACAIGSEIRFRGAWERIGRPHGRIACFSFHPRKVVTTGDGGMLTTADAALAARFRLLRHHAMSLPATARHDTNAVVFEEFLEPAFNLRMTDIQAAVGRPQLARLAALVAERRALADRYAAELAGSAVEPAREPDWARCNWQSYPVTLRSGVGQREALQHLLDRGIAARRGVSNAHQEPAYAGRGNWNLPVSERVRDTTILLPLFNAMTRDEQDQVIAACRELG